MKSFKLYQGQELEYDGQRMEWGDDAEEEQEEQEEPVYLPKSALKRLKVQQAERQEEKALVEELEEWEKEDRQDSAMGIFILCGFLVIALTNLMKYGQL